MSPYIPLGLIGIALFLVVLVKPKLAVIILLFVRPILDAFRNVYIPGPWGGILNPSGIISIVFIIASGIWMMKRPIRLDSPLLGCYVAFLAICAVSISWSPNAAASFGEWLRLVSFLFLYLIIRNTVRSLDWIGYMVIAVIGSSIIPIGVAIYQMATRQFVYQGGTGIPQIISVFAHQNVFGIYLAFIGPVVILTSITQVSRSKKMLYGAWALIICFFLVSIYARVAWFGFIVSACVIGILRYRKWLVVLPLGLSLVWLLVPNVSVRMSLIFASTVSENSLLSRLEVWKDALAVFRSSPIFGAGLRSFNVLSETMSYIFGYTAFQGVSVHNAYLQFLAETGVLGIGSFLLIQFVLVKDAIRACRIVKNLRLQPVVLGFAGMLAGGLVMGLIDNLVTSPVIQWYLWAFAGLSKNAGELAKGRWRN